MNFPKTLNQTYVAKEQLSKKDLQETERQHKRETQK